MPGRFPITVEQVPGGRAWASLSRRVRTLILTGVLFAVLFALALTMPVPYVILSPGPTLNTLGDDHYGNTIIMINGKTANQTTGHLNLTTVSVTTQSISAFQAIQGWLESDEVVVPRSAIYPPGQSESTTNAQNTAEFVDSQDSAIAASACELGYPRRFGVVGVLSDGASAKVLKPADVIESVDGASVTNEKTLEKALSPHQQGTTVSLRVLRAGKQQTVSVTLGKGIQGRKYGSLGIQPGTICAAPYSVDLGLANQIGGPSAGLMFALGIMDKVGTVDLTGGKFIAGTGEINTEGRVSPIGGIQLKMIAARDAGATIFLAPAGNCSDVVGAIPSGLDVIKVSTLHGAVQALEDVQKGDSVPHC